MALAACFDKGIGVIERSELTALIIYRKLLRNSIDSDQVERSSAVLYKISKILKDHKRHAESEVLLKWSLKAKFMCSRSDGPSKTFAYDLAKLLTASTKQESRNLDLAIGLYKIAYDMSCSVISEYLIHYKIEKKLRNLMVLYQSHGKIFDARHWVITDSFLRTYNVKQRDIDCQYKIREIVKSLRDIFGIQDTHDMAQELMGQKDSYETTCYNLEDHFRECGQIVSHHECDLEE
jgi:hypothetical protein